ncbi:MAG: AEC family transporter [Pseudomonadota bacterium]
MQALLTVILPVFLVIGMGYGARWANFFGDDACAAITRFAQNVAFPALLFNAIARLDLGAGFDMGLLGSFYGGAITCFGLGFLGARRLFRRPLPDSIAIGFCCLFSNSLLLGLPITERAFGPDALDANFVIIALHAPVCYAVGLTAMELARAEGRGVLRKAGSILRSIFRNALIVGIALGFAVNLTGLPVPSVVNDALVLVASAGLPAALFALGGVLYRYRPEGDAATIAMVCLCSLVVHPALVWAFGGLAGLSEAQFRSAVITAAMAPGVNTYIFANLYGVGRRVAASSVLVGTAASLITAWFWLTALP